MFVKTVRSKQGDTTYVNHYLAESYWDHDKRAPRNRNLLSLKGLGEQAVETLKKAFSEEYTLIDESAVDLRCGDALRGAGSLALWRAWQKTGMDRVLSKLTDKQRQSVKAMVFSRILNPCSRLALKQQMGDHLLSRLYSKTRLDEDTLYEVMDRVYEQFEGIQDQLNTAHESPSHTLMLYDTTSTYFEGTQAEPGEYGHSKDHRWDRYQIIVGLVCDGQGLPVAVRVWPGNTHDGATVNKSIQMLSEKFGLEQVVFVGDSGMYGTEQIEQIQQAGYGYIVALAYQKKRQQLLDLAPQQLELFDQQGFYQWEHGGQRYVGYHSRSRQKRAKARRIKAMKDARETLEALGQTARSGRYYHKMRLHEKARGILSRHGVADLLSLNITALEEGLGDRQKGLFDLEVCTDQLGLDQRKALEGKYILQTSLPRKDYSPKQLDKAYRSLQQVEDGFRHIKSYLKIRPIYHRLQRRINAHVLICFLAYFLVKWMQIRLREQGERRQVEPLLRRWDQLRLVCTQLSVATETTSQYQWCRGERGEQIIDELKQVGWWQSVNAYKHSITNRLQADS